MESKPNKKQSVMVIEMDNMDSEKDKGGEDS